MTKDNLSPLDKELIISYRRYITYQKRLSDKTREVYSREAAMYLSYLNERGKKVEDIGPGEIEEYLIKRR
ncbi:MAG: site-specific integrase, partial [Spirochaetes bacterium]|nr:site-specific integrase [Candidatus Ornithospirochaeta stercoravium]